MRFPLYLICFWPAEIPGGNTRWPARGRWGPCRRHRTWPGCRAASPWWPSAQSAWACWGWPGGGWPSLSQLWCPFKKKFCRQSTSIVSFHQRKFTCTQRWWHIYPGDTGTPQRTRCTRHSTCGFAKCCENLLKISRQRNAPPGCYSHHDILGIYLPGHFPNFCLLLNLKYYKIKNFRLWLFQCFYIAWKAL